MASGVIPLFVVILMMVAVISRTIDNKIYDPDEFEYMRKSPDIKNPVVTKSNTTEKPRHTDDKIKGHENTVVNGTEAKVEDRFVGDAPCREGLVQIGDKCVKSAKLRTK